MREGAGRALMSPSLLWYGPCPRLRALAARAPPDLIRLRLGEVLQATSREARKHDFVKCP